jgi:hypothetical protein
VARWRRPARGPTSPWAAGFPSGLSLLFSPHGLTPSVSTATIPHLRHTHTRTMPPKSVAVSGRAFIRSTLPGRLTGLTAGI